MLAMHSTILYMWGKIYCEPWYATSNSIMNKHQTSRATEIEGSCPAFVIKNKTETRLGRLSYFYMIEQYTFKMRAQYGIDKNDSKIKLIKNKNQNH